MLEKTQKSRILSWSVHGEEKEGRRADLRERHQNDQVILNRKCKSISYYQLMCFRVLAEKFRFIPRFKPSKFGAYVNGTWTEGVVQEVTQQGA